MPIRDVEDLRIYQLSLKLLEIVYRLAKLVEREDRVMARDLRKTAIQIAPQIAEGYAKKSSLPEFKRYLQIAMGSSDEMVTHLKQVKLVCRSVKPETCDALIEHYRSLSKQISTTITRWS